MSQFESLVDATFQEAVEPRGLLVEDYDHSCFISSLVDLKRIPERLMSDEQRRLDILIQSGNDSLVQREKFVPYIIPVDCQGIVENALRRVMNHEDPRSDDYNKALYLKRRLGI